MDIVCTTFDIVKEKNMLVFAALMPHPPESVPGIGSPDDFVVIQKTLHSFEKLEKDLRKADPDTILIISPHAPMDKYSFVLNSSSELNGTFENFGLESVLVYDNNIEIADKISFACTLNEMPCLLQGHFLDHGALIPIYHLTKKYSAINMPKIVHLSFSFMNYERHYRYGEIIRGVINSYKGRVAVIASGDLSHIIGLEKSKDALRMADEFDHEVMRYLGSNDLASLMSLEDKDAKKVRECGMRSIVILLGILHGKQYEFNLLSYERPFGVGYLTARLL
ncbi:MAG: AMMECR1 domain protein [Candidatus Moranbacteria bacterium GW2011_GWE1_36_7]|nr:MAG: AMMECR1 domain protein [Candidatus Moranbacteria bacterium GW2011_GWD2_36_12]KKQ06836.1 MAG: AMMECR1 domain protein [Candidatus Moranbacteria bacterium GW2011_GWE2_36_40]KKQ15426.1 MAG: AMMECR1 domain protein [Candidatus Moranbacteria bacterium GW2011_GWE1_36_7]